jgi:hypothetical protein
VRGSRPAASDIQATRRPGCALLVASDDTPHQRPETPRLRSGTTVIAPLVSGDPSTALGVTCFEGAFGAFFTCHFDQASFSEPVEKSPEEYEPRLSPSDPSSAVGTARSQPPKSTSRAAALLARPWVANGGPRRPVIK